MNRERNIYACLYAREFPLQTLLRLRSHLQTNPCVVLEGEPPLQRVCSLNSAAERQGLVCGMTRVEVDSVPSIQILLRSFAEESTARAMMLECAGTFSPRVEERRDANAFICLIDISGSQKLLGTPELVARAILDRVWLLGITACVAVSHHFDTAICLAKSMIAKKDIMIVPAGEEASVLSSLQLEVLDISEDHLKIFSSWGVYTLGQLAALPENALVARTGEEGRRLWQLARAQSPHLFLPVEAAATLEELFELDTPVEALESLLFVIGMMLEQLILRAASRVLALASMTITLHLEGEALHVRSVRPALPNNDRALWIKLIHLDLEAHPPMAAVVALTLTAEPGHTSKMQLGLFSPQVPESAKLDVTLARIQAIVGEGCVGRAVLKDTHEPDAFRIQPFVVSSVSAKEFVCEPSRTALRQLRPAEVTTVTLRDEQPEALRFCEKRYVVEHVYGPWITSGDWWNTSPWAEQQWDLVARAEDGALLCCCLVHDVVESRWLMTALYD